MKKMCKNKILTNIVFIFIIFKNYMFIYYLYNLIYIIQKKKKY